MGWLSAVVTAPERHRLRRFGLVVLVMAVAFSLHPAAGTSNGGCRAVEAGATLELIGRPELAKSRSAARAYLDAHPAIARVEICRRDTGTVVASVAQRRSSGEPHVGDDPLRALLQLQRAAYAERTHASIAARGSSHEEHHGR